MEDANSTVFNMITMLNELKTLTKNISYDYKNKFDGGKFNSNQKWKNNKGKYEYKNSIKHSVCKKDYVWNPSTCACEINYAYMESLIEDSVVTFDEIIDAVTKLYVDTTEIVLINSNNKNETCKMDNYYFANSFVSNHIVIRNCYYLLLLRKTLVKALVKTKRHITISLI